jgi:predicted MPP superfamily phosphohydrolase
MKNRLILFILFIVLLFQAGCLREKKAHVIIWGDSEGMLRRPGDSEELNPAMLKFIERLQYMDGRNPIDLILCTGDFVRFDPITTHRDDFAFFKHFPRDLLAKHYPTIGGDQEFLDGKYNFYAKNVGPLLENTRVYAKEKTITQLIQKALKTAKDENKHYYHLENEALHVISLWSPDNLDEIERTPELAKHDIFNPTIAKSIPQYRWLVKTLWNIREVNKDNRAIAVLSHRPVFNRAGKHLYELFDAFDVDLVLSGDQHLYAHHKHRGVNYIITGMMGDELDDCSLINEGYLGKRGNNFAVRISDYKTCISSGKVIRNGQAFSWEKDHYIDMTVNFKRIKLQVIELKSMKAIKNTKLKIKLKREKQSNLRKRIYQDLFH